MTTSEQTDIQIKTEKRRIGRRTMEQTTQVFFICLSKNHLFLVKGDTAAKTNNGQLGHVRFGSAARNQV